MSEPLDQKFWQIGEGDRGYVSRNGGFGDPGPAYVVTTAARRLIWDGRQVTLPEGYSEDALDQMAWLFGQVVPDGVEVRVSPRQASEVAQIAAGLLADHRDSLKGDEIEACDFVAETVHQASGEA